MLASEPLLNQPLSKESVSVSANFVLCQLVAHKFKIGLLLQRLSRLYMVLVHRDHDTGSMAQRISVLIDQVLLDVREKHTPVDVRHLVWPENDGELQRILLEQAQAMGEVT